MKPLSENESLNETWPPVKQMPISLFLSTLPASTKVQAAKPGLGSDDLFWYAHAVTRILRASFNGPSDSYHGLPVYSLVAAGAPFQDNPETRLIGRVHPPENLRSWNAEYFVGRIEGQSMEPRIPSGSYCIFRFFVPGSRTGRTVLV